MPLSSQICIAVRLPFVSQYASHLYRNTPPICIAILLGKSWWLSGMFSRFVPRALMSSQKNFHQTGKTPTPKISALVRFLLTAKGQQQQLKTTSDSRGKQRDKLNGTNGAKFAVFFRRFLQILEITAFGGADFRRKPQETAEFERNPFVPCSLSL